MLERATIHCEHDCTYHNLRTTCKSQACCLFQEPSSILVPRNCTSQKPGGPATRQSDIHVRSNWLVVEQRVDCSRRYGCLPKSPHRLVCQYWLPMPHTCAFPQRLAFGWRELPTSEKDWEAKAFPAPRIAWLMQEYRPSPLLLEMFTENLYSAFYSVQRQLFSHNISQPFCN